MATYRYQVVSVGLWRGKIKRWNTTFHLISSTGTAALYAAMQATGWKLAGDVTGACSGGVASIQVYNSTGGSPIASTVYFDWETPSTWIPYTGTAWSGIDADTPLDASGESAVVVIGHMPGLSSSGKPVTTRKYLHAIPSRTATNYSDPDVPPSVASSIASLFTTSIMRSPSGVAPDSVSCSAYYLNHQRVRGRRRPKAQVAAQSFAGGVVAGSGITPGGAASPQ